MNELERQNIAVLRPGLSAAVDKVRMTGQPLVIQKNNRDIAAIIPIEKLNAMREKQQSRKK